MSWVADGSGEVSIGASEASKVSVQMFDTASNVGVRVKSAGSAGLSAFEYEMATVFWSASLSVTEMVSPVKPTLAFS